ncbi:hypothetical protein V494_05735 [Pseudogymnoascus sp. VKM F-4513 (FW-928)]|nr:hypothetical protein V494_05735 [Pseudogymnoascus sp. VKM F-4513 (FW-928)]
MAPYSLHLRRSLDSHTKILIIAIVVSSVVGTLTIIGLYYLFRYCRQRRRKHKSVRNSAEEAWQKQHVYGAWSVSSHNSQPVSEYAVVEAPSDLDGHSDPSNTQRNNQFLSGYTQRSNYVAVRSASPPPYQPPVQPVPLLPAQQPVRPVSPPLADSPTLPLLVVQHNRSVSMPPPRPPRPDSMISPLTPGDIADVPDHLLYSNDSITSRGGEPYRPYSLPTNSPTHIPQMLPPPESHPFPQPPYDSPIDLWMQPPTPPPRSNKRVSRARAVNRKVSIVRKPVPIPVHMLLSQPKCGGLAGLSGLRRSDTGYSSHYSDASSIGRADSNASMGGRHTWAPQSALAYAEISASTPFDKTDSLERTLTRREHSRLRLSNVVEKDDTNEASKVVGNDGEEQDDTSASKGGENAAEVPELESDRASSGDEGKKESRSNTPDPTPAPLRIIKRRHEMEVPVLQLPRPKSFEERREMGRIYAV